MFETKANEKNDRVIILLATGSEVQLCIDAAKAIVESKEINLPHAVEVVSAPCLEIFEEQNDTYKKKVLHTQRCNIISVEASSTFGWYKYASHCIGIDSFGLSGPGNDVYKHFGFTVDRVVEKIMSL